MSKIRRSGAGLIGFICFACCGVSIEKVVMWHPFFAADSCSRKFLMSILYRFPWVVVKAGPMIRSSLSFISGDGFLIPVTSFFVYTCNCCQSWFVLLVESNCPLDLIQDR